MKPIALFAPVVSVLTHAVASASAWGQTWDSGESTKGNPSEVIFWCAVLLGTAVLMGLTFYIIRKRLKAQEDQPASISAGFSLSDLRQMHAEGQLSDTEFEVAKNKIIAKAKANMDAPIGDSPPDPPPIVTNLGDITDRPAVDGPTDDQGPTDNNDGPDDAEADPPANGPET